MSDTKSITGAITASEARIVTLSRREVRALGDDIPLDYVELTDALDRAQGDADEPGKTAYVVIRIRGEEL
ncbi:hypothetical protein [Methylobacterium nodulans]|uniref:Uncharacterized protein n=1 Tax=Methylobacterium nodulans (strain LMG 21967 / CNCM I-2342 / ORS 2060) TaxID=460265 RepID=B8IVF7_METNO|nr:hypothetical protein [Methylobacterium nodulans]ACL61008.1 hypothetical protein Mnod_6200 [Methylobacterium nodulans ORS 2060]